MSTTTRNKGFFDLHNVEEEDHWISVSDLMAGLMMVFLFISIALMRSAMLERDMIEDIAQSYEDNQAALYEALMNEFGNDLDAWGARIDRQTLAVEFQSPEVLFDRAQTTLKPRFKAILADFFPRYIRVLTDFRESIGEVRIEGHTSSIWNRFTSPDAAYFKNMELSQGRTRSVLEYAYQLDEVAEARDWIKTTLAAVGFSSAHIKRLPSGKEDLDGSRRVSFRVITNSEEQIRKILEHGQ